MSGPALYPLIQSQQTVWMAFQFYPIKSAANICICLDIETEVDQSLLTQSVFLGMLRNPASAIRLRRVGKKIMQYFSSQTPDKVETLDFSELSQKEKEEYYHQWSRTAFPNSQMDTQLYVIKIIKQQKARYSLYFCVSHMIFDSYSLMTTVYDILQVYAALRDQTPLPRERLSPLPLYQKEINYPNTKQYQKDWEFWKAFYSTEPRYTSINGKKDPSSKGPSKRAGQGLMPWQVKGAAIDKTIPREIVTAVREYAKSAGVSEISLYLLGIRSYLSMVNDFEEDICIENAITRRGSVAKKNAGGTLADAVSIRTVFGSDITFAEACKKVYHSQTSSYRHSNISAMERDQYLKKKFGIGPFHTYNSIALSFQPYINMDSLNLPFSFRNFCNGCAYMPVYLTILPTDHSGSLTANYLYAVKFIQPETLETFHSFLLCFLKDGIRYPDRTIKQLIN